jgi:uncharacterized protein HemX
MDFINNFVRSNAYSLLILLFVAGGVYTQFKQQTVKLDRLEQELQLEINILENRLSKKIQLINELEDKIQGLEVRIAILETTP